MDFQLMAVNDSAQNIGVLTFGGWVSKAEAIKTMREEFPDAIGILAVSGWQVVWQDSHALGALS